MNQFFKGKKGKFSSIFSATIAAAFIGCGPVSEEEMVEGEEVGTVSQALDAARTRVIQECSQAMWGSWWTHNETSWPTGTTPGTYNYSAADAGAWNLLLANYGGTATNGTYYPGFYVSCMRTRAQGHLPAPYTTCSLSTSTGYGSYEQPNYACQGGACTAPRGGQCKPFMNLVAYRSGLYQNPGYAWKSFPNDNCIKHTSASCNTSNKILRPTNDANMPMATYANILEGDYLRRPYGHALIVVRKISSSQVIVLDSNWIGGGDGNEKIGSHSMAFSSGDSDSNLGAYRVLKCAYTGGC